MRFLHLMSTILAVAGLTLRGGGYLLSIFAVILSLYAVVRVEMVADKVLRDAQGQQLKIRTDLGLEGDEQTPGTG